MKDWKQILYDIYTPEIGSLWAAPNYIWSNGFASNKASENLHPAVVEKISSCRTIVHIIPGTSKNYKQGSCVFKIRILPADSDSAFSYFLIKLSMPFTKDKLMALRQGWDGVVSLNEQQVAEFGMQIKFCKG